MKSIIPYNKLIRDNIPSIIALEGKSCSIEQLDTDSFHVELRKKLIEEALEVQNAISKTQLVGELADVLEIVETLMKEYGISELELEEKKLDKRLKNGGFEKKLFLVSVSEEGDENE